LHHDLRSEIVDHKLIWNNPTEGDIESNPIKIGMSYVDPVGGLYPALALTLTTSTTNGTVTKSPDQASYAAGMVVTLTATPDSGYTISGWSGSASDTSNLLHVTMDGKKTITANFQAAPVLTFIAVSPMTSSVMATGTVQFTAIGHDQNGAQLSPQPTFTWTVSGGGTISATGLFTAGTSEGGPRTWSRPVGVPSAAPERRPCPWPIRRQPSLRPPRPAPTRSRAHRPRSGCWVTTTVARPA
jgi:hypothetical protein